MEVGKTIVVRYDNGKTYSGEVVAVKAMEPGDGHETERVLFVLKVDNGYRSLYVHKCISVAEKDSIVDFCQYQYKRKIWAAKVRRYAKG